MYRCRWQLRAKCFQITAYRGIHSIFDIASHTSRTWTKLISESPNGIRNHFVPTGLYRFHRLTLPDNKNDNSWPSRLMRAGFSLVFIRDSLLICGHKNQMAFLHLNSSFGGLNATFSSWISSAFTELMSRNTVY